jgi:hypothetical protein
MSVAKLLHNLIPPRGERGRKSKVAFRSADHASSSPRKAFGPRQLIMGDKALVVVERTPFSKLTRRSKIDMRARRLTVIVQFPSPSIRSLQVGGRLLLCYVY